jgi:ribosomal-protein-alanine N-acetyltransferase
MRQGDLERVIEIGGSLQGAPIWRPSAYREALDPAHIPKRIALVAVEGESEVAAGFAVASVIAPDGELETISVVAEAQRRGIGRQLLAALVDSLKLEGVDTINLEVRAGNHAALRLYRAAGFAETGRRLRYYTEPVEDAIRMRRRAQ